MSFAALLLEENVKKMEPGHLKRVESMILQSPPLPHALVNSHSGFQINRTTILNYISIHFVDMAFRLPSDWRNYDLNHLRVCHQELRGIFSF